MVPLRNIFGRTTKGLCTGSFRVRGAKQGDSMMPLLFAVGQHGALEAIHRRMNPGEFLVAFHDDSLHVVLGLAWLPLPMVTRFFEIAQSYQHRTVKKTKHTKHRRTR